jgi:hypothetical protein
MDGVRLYLRRASRSTPGDQAGLRAGEYLTPFAASVACVAGVPDRDGRKTVVSNPHLSIVVPVHDEAESIEPLYRELFDE